MEIKIGFLLRSHGQPDKGLVQYHDYLCQWVMNIQLSQELLLNPLLHQRIWLLSSFICQLYEKMAEI